MLRDNAHECEALSIFKRASSIPGYMNRDDALHIGLLLGLQNSQGIQGDILEIGSWFGRSAGFFANWCNFDQRLHVCDAFEKETEDKYGQTPTEEVLRRNIRAIAPFFDQNKLVVYSCLSQDLILDPSLSLRFVHIDGGHSEVEARHDLEIVAPLIIEGGIIVVDDYRHPDWPEVEQAVSGFLDDHPNFRIAAALNRWDASGQKCYIARRM